MKTCSVKPSDIQKKWLLVDASDQQLGRLASEIARLLRGKHKPNFVPHLDCGDNVIVTNAKKISLTGRKLDQKFYFHHSGYIGGIKGISAKDLLEKNPTHLIELAVKGMLPKNKLSAKIMKNLRIYAGNDHDQSAQRPEAAPERTQKEATTSKPAEKSAPKAKAAEPKAKAAAPKKAAPAEEKAVKTNKYGQIVQKK